jgi:hypothetical protein
VLLDLSVLVATRPARDEDRLETATEREAAVAMGAAARRVWRVPAASRPRGHAQDARPVGMGVVRRLDRHGNARGSGKWWRPRPDLGGDKRPTADAARDQAAEPLERRNPRAERAAAFTGAPAAGAGEVV